jgi:hypothetical protein
VWANRLEGKPYRSLAVGVNANLGLAERIAQTSAPATDDQARVFTYTNQCNNGSMQGCANLGTMYLMGWGAAKDSSLAVSLFRKACDGGEKDGCDSLQTWFTSASRASPVTPPSSFTPSVVPAPPPSFEAAKYASRPILLLDATPGVEAVMPMIVTADGQQHLEFVPAPKIKESIDKGGHPVTLADVMSLLGAANQKVNELQVENDKLWKVAAKDGPKSEIVIVPQAAPAGPSEAELANQRNAEANARRQMAIQILLGMNRSQPYQLPMPVNPNANRFQTNCTTYRLGDITHTTCN